MTLKSISHKRILLTGLIIVTPVFVTFWLLGLFVGLVNDAVTPFLFRLIVFFLPESMRSSLDYLAQTIIAPLISVFLSIVVVYIIGVIGTNVLGRRLLTWIEAVLLRLPIIGNIYKAIRQVVDTFSGPSGGGFRGVALVEFPHPGAFTLGFLTGEVKGAVKNHLGEGFENVFVPTSPNPTSGYLVFMPKHRIKSIDMSIDDAFKLVMSGGVLTSEDAKASG